jgi:hypothetical protein
LRGFGSNGGDITIKAHDALRSSFVDIASSVNADFGGGRGGNITIEAPKVILDETRIFSTSATAGFEPSTGPAGTITINADVLRAKKSRITTAASIGDGGNININASKLVELVNSLVEAEVFDGEGKGGNIRISSESLVANNSVVAADAFGAPGGNVTVRADVFLPSSNSSITASSALSTPRTVDIQAPIVDLAGSLAPLPESVLAATTLMQQSCATRFSSGKASSLVAASKEGLPLEPGGFMPSSLSRSEDQFARRDGEPNGQGYSPTLRASVNPLLTQGGCTK